LEDEFDDVAKQEFAGYVYSEGFLAFVGRNLLEGPTLDVGCGSGSSFALFPITSALEANPSRYERAKMAGAGKVDVRLGAAECLPFGPGSMANVLHLQGFFQVRSDWETMIEYNRVLGLGGRFIFDFPIPSKNVVFGRPFGSRGYAKVLCDFGFDLVELREPLEDGFAAMCLEKKEEWDYRKMKKIQLIPRGDGGLYEAKNFDSEDWTYR
jgi:SAM-dependent methyltransferase